MYYLNAGELHNTENLQSARNLQITEDLYEILDSHITPEI